MAGLFKHSTSEVNKKQFISCVRLRAIVCLRKEEREREREAAGEREPFPRNKYIFALRRLRNRRNVREKDKASSPQHKVFTQDEEHLGEGKLWNVLL